jgi:hypothetical protein
MAFVERVVMPGLTAEQYDSLRQAVTSEGPIEGEILQVAGDTPDGFCVIDLWESQEHCDRAMERWMKVFQDQGITMEGMSPPERFDVHALHTSSGVAAG